MTTVLRTGVELPQTTIRISNFDEDNLRGLQEEIINLIQCYNYEGYPAMKNPFYETMRLLESTLPNYWELRLINTFRELQGQILTDQEKADWFDNYAKRLGK